MLADAASTPQLDMYDEQFEQLQFEVDSMRLCKHPNVVELIEDFDTPDVMYIVLEMLPSECVGACRRRCCVVCCVDRGPCPGVVGCAAS